MTSECFYCGVLYSRNDALEANVPEEYSGTYCTERCMNLDQAQIKADVLSECKEEVLASAEGGTMASITTIAGFNLKVKK